MPPAGSWGEKVIVFLTSTTYAQWLPGDARGFVSNVDVGGNHLERHNRYGTPFDADMPQLRQSAKERLKGEPVVFNQKQAEVLFGQFCETARIRHWTLIGVAIMFNHVHILIEVGDDANPDDVMRDLKSYGSGALNRTFGKPKSGTWWTTSGSKRRKTSSAIPEVIKYLKRQPNPLVLWINPNYDIQSQEPEAQEPGASAPGWSESPIISFAATHPGTLMALIQSTTTYTLPQR